MFYLTKNVKKRIFWGESNSSLWKRFKQGLEGLQVLAFSVLTVNDKHTRQT